MPSTLSEMVCRNCYRRLAPSPNGWRHWTNTEYLASGMPYWRAADYAVCENVQPRNLSCFAQCGLDHNPNSGHRQFLNIDGTYIHPDVPSWRGESRSAYCPDIRETRRYCSDGGHWVAVDADHPWNDESDRCEECNDQYVNCDNCGYEAWADDTCSYNGDTLCQECYDNATYEEEDCNCSDCRYDRGEVDDISMVAGPPDDRNRECGELRIHLDELTGEFVCMCEAIRIVAAGGVIRFKQEAA